MVIEVENDEDIEEVDEVGAVIVVVVVDEVVDKVEDEVEAEVGVEDVDGVSEVEGVVEGERASVEVDTNKVGVLLVLVFTLGTYIIRKERKAITHRRRI